MNLIEDRVDVRSYPLLRKIIYKSLDRFYISQISVFEELIPDMTILIEFVDGVIDERTEWYNEMKNKYPGRKIDNINDIKNLFIWELEKSVNMNVGEKKKENVFIGGDGGSFIEEVISFLRRFNDEDLPDGWITWMMPLIM